MSHEERGRPGGLNTETAENEKHRGRDAENSLTDPTLTKAERTDLLKLARMRERVARSEVDQRAAELRADVEQKLSAVYKFSDEAWADVTATANKEVEQADTEIARICHERGIPEEFRPRIVASWLGRGENASNSRRAELRKTAYSRIEAKAKEAKHQIAAASVQAQTDLLATGLTSEAAQSYLAAMPTPEALMPEIEVAELEQGGGR